MSQYTCSLHVVKRDVFLYLQQLHSNSNYKVDMSQMVDEVKRCSSGEGTGAQEVWFPLQPLASTRGRSAYKIASITLAPSSPMTQVPMPSETVFAAVRRMQFPSVACVCVPGTIPSKLCRQQCCHVPLEVSKGCLASRAFSNLAAYLLQVSEWIDAINC